jgi:hypothetical protein
MGAIWNQSCVPAAEHALDDRGSAAAGAFFSSTLTVFNRKRLRQRFLIEVKVIKVQCSLAKPPVLVRAQITARNQIHHPEVLAPLAGRTGLCVRVSYAKMQWFSISLIINDLNMVEAAGVEPASEIHVSRETPCVVEFRRLRTTRSEPTRCA